MWFFKRDRQPTKTVSTDYLSLREKGQSCYTPEYFAAHVDVQKQRNAVVDNAINITFSSLTSLLYYWFVVYSDVDCFSNYTPLVNTVERSERIPLVSTSKAVLFVGDTPEFDLKKTAEMVRPLAYSSRHANILNWKPLSREESVMWKGCEEVEQLERTIRNEQRRSGTR